MSQVLRERICRNAACWLQECPPELLPMNFMLISTISHLQRHFRRNWPYIQPSLQPQTTCKPTSPGPPHPASSPPRSSETSHQLLQQSVCINKAFLHKMSETVSGKLICMLIVLIGVSTWLQFIIVTDLSGQMLTFDGVWHFGEVFTVESRFSPYRADGRQRVWRCVGERIAVGLWYGQAYVMDNEHRCILLMAFWMHRDTVTRSWGSLLCHLSTTITSSCSIIMHGPMLQGPVHNSCKLKTSQFLHGQHTHWTCHPLSMFGMLWIGVYDSVFKFLPISSNFAQPLKRSGPTFHRPKSTTWSTLREGDVLHCMRQMVVTPDTDWFSDPLPLPHPPNTVKLHILERPFIVASLRHTCAIIMLSNQHLDMPHLWGGWIISAKEKCSLTHI